MTRPTATRIGMVIPFSVLFRLESWYRVMLEGSRVSAHLRHEAPTARREGWY